MARYFFYPFQGPWHWYMWVELDVGIQSCEKFSASGHDFPHHSRCILIHIFQSVNRSRIFSQAGNKLGASSFPARNELILKLTKKRPQISLFFISRPPCSNYWRNEKYIRKRNLSMVIQANFLPVQKWSKSIKNNHLCYFHLIHETHCK